MDLLSRSRFPPALLTRQRTPAPPPALSTALLQARNSSGLATNRLYWGTYTAEDLNRSPRAHKPSFPAAQAERACGLGEATWD